MFFNINIESAKLINANGNGVERLVLPSLYEEIPGSPFDKLNVSYNFKSLQELGDEVINDNDIVRSGEETVKENDIASIGEQTIKDNSIGGIGESVIEDTTPDLSNTIKTPDLPVDPELLKAVNGLEDIG